MSGSSSVSGNTADRGGGITNTEGTLTMTDTSSVRGNSADRGGGIGNFGDITLKDSASVFDNTATSTGGGIYNNMGVISACDATSVEEWVGTVEPNSPNDYLDGDVPLTPSGTGGCS
jgi:predicted outer membrane repeat protein